MVRSRVRRGRLGKSLVIKDMFFMQGFVIWFMFMQDCYFVVSSSSLCWFARFLILVM